jgi:hypothetical protein
MANSIVALTDTASQIAELQRRQKLAEALSAQGAAPIEVQSYKGIQAPISPLSGIAKVLQAYLGAKQSADIAKGDKEARQTARDEAVSYLESMKRTPDIGRFETPVSVEDARQQAAVPALTPVAPAGPPEMMQVGGVPTDMQGGVTPTASVQAPMPQVYSDAQPSAYMGPQATVMPGRERTPQERMAMALQAQMSGNEYAAAATKPEYERGVAEAADQAEVDRIINDPAFKKAPQEIQDRVLLASRFGAPAVKAVLAEMYKPEEMTANRRDYEYAIKSGQFKGSLQDWIQQNNPKTAILTPGSTAYNSYGFANPPTAQPAPTAGAPTGSAPTANVPSIVENNNPGALEYRPWMKKYGAAVSEDGRFAKFPTPEAGIQAQNALITNDYVGKGVNTIDTIVDKYLGKGSENTFEQRANYKTYVAQKTGLPLGQQVTAADIPKLTEAMRQFETGQRVPAPTAAPAPKGPPRPLIAIPPKPEQPTAAEQTSVYNIGRILRGAVEIKKALKRNPSAIAPSALEAAVGAIPVVDKAVNFTRSSDRQIVSAVQRDIVDALLNLSTGAAYNKEQRQGQIESYIPAFSDKPETRASKNKRFNELVVESKSKAGKAWTPEMEKIANGLKAANGLFESASTTSAKPAVVQPKINNQPSDDDLVNQYLPKPGKR